MKLYEGRPIHGGNFTTAKAQGNYFIMVILTLILENSTIKADKLRGAFLDKNLHTFEHTNQDFVFWRKSISVAIHAFFFRVKFQTSIFVCVKYLTFCNSDFEA